MHRMCGSLESPCGRAISVDIGDLCRVTDPYKASFVPVYWCCLTRYFTCVYHYSSAERDAPYRREDRPVCPEFRTGRPNALRCENLVGFVLTNFFLCHTAGPPYTLVYNDAYSRILGAEHAGALGRSGADVWAELWAALSVQFEQVRNGGAAVYADEALLTMEPLGKAPQKMRGSPMR